MTACLVLRRPHDCPWCICLCLIFCHFLPISSPICFFMSFLFLSWELNSQVSSALFSQIMKPQA